MRAALWLAATCLLLLVTSGYVSAGAPVRTKNGVRLVGSSGSKGRVQLLTRNPYFLLPKKTSQYVNVCDEGFDDWTAQIMCTILGYKYGRKYYEPKVTYAANETSRPGGSVRCQRPMTPYHHRRLLSTQQQQQQQQGASRRQLLPLIAKVEIPSKVPYECIFLIGECEASGPLAGIECSSTPMPPAPAPPPSPPNPPPAPPPVSLDIRIIGGASYPMAREIEPNVCNATGGDQQYCGMYGRVEMAVPDKPGSSNKVFAPVCAVASPELLADVATVACQQNFDWPSAKWAPIMYVWSNVPETPYSIPTGTTTSALDFTPAKAPGWVTIQGLLPGVANPLRLQDFNHTVSKNRCAGGKMMALYCSVATARH